jgi:hypothetical protein
MSKQSKVIILIILLVVTKVTKVSKVIIVGGFYRIEQVIARLYFGLTPATKVKFVSVLWLLCSLWYFFKGAVSWGTGGLAVPGRIGAKGDSDGYPIPQGAALGFFRGWALSGVLAPWGDGGGTAIIKQE